MSIEKSLRSVRENGTWITKDKREIKISELEDDHLVNILKMLVRYGETCRAQYLMLVGSVYFNGEMAQYYVDQEIEGMIESEWYENIMEQRGVEMLLAEAERRKIQCQSHVPFEKVSNDTVIIMCQLEDS